MTIDLLFTNKPLSFQRTSTTVVTTETGSSDCHNLISLFVRSFISPLMPKTIFFRNYQKFDDTKFESNLKNTNLSFTSANTNENYLFLRNSFSKKIEKYVPLKKKTLRGNHAPFVFKDLGKAVYTRNRFRNKLLKNNEKLNINFTSNSETSVSLYSKEINQASFF